MLVCSIAMKDIRQHKSVPFAPGIISKPGRYEYGSVFSKDGNTCYFAVVNGGKPEIHYSVRRQLQWSTPAVLLQHQLYGFNDPFLTPDEQSLFFISDMALNGKGPKKDIDIWYIKRTANGWTDPINAGSVINSDSNEYYTSFTRSGTIYFASNRNQKNATTANNYDIYFSTKQNGKFKTPVALPEAINSQHYEADVFIAPDETFIIFCAERPGGLGKGDLYFSRKTSDGKWSPAQNLGPSVNTSGYEFCPFVSNNGKTLFFSRDGDIYSVDFKLP